MNFFCKTLLQILAVAATTGVSTLVKSQSIAQGIVDSKPQVGMNTMSGMSADDLELKLFKLSQMLLQAPENPALLLQKGVLLTQLGRNKAAFEVFESLRIAYPNHPKPYANLASLYARSGRLEEARQMLMKADALQGNSDQTTQLSLATVNLELALSALHRANEINPNDPAIQQKLQTLEKYFAETDKTSHVTSRELSPTASSSSVMPRAIDGMSADKPLRTQAQNLKRGSQDRLMLSAIDIDPPTANPLPSKLLPALPSLPLAPTVSRTSSARMNELAQEVSSDDDGRKAGVIKTLEAWSKAWTQRAYDSYAANYSAEFRPSDGLTREAWALRKKALIEQAQYIKVDIKVTQVEVNGQTATVKIKQQYKSDSYAENGKKELKLAMEEDKWKILSEKPLK